MEAQLIPELTKICQAVKIASPTEASFAGRRVPEVGIPGQQPMSQQQMLASGQNPMIWRLQSQLYMYCYCQQFTGTIPEEPKPDHPSQVQDPNFLQSLSQANTSRERWESGWQIYRVEASSQVMAQKFGTNRMFWPGQFFCQEGAGMAPRVGANISVFLPRESFTIQPGFYYVFSETQIGYEDDYNQVRFYWHLQEQGAATLIRCLTQKLNQFQVPFRFKCLTSWNSNLPRSDSAVLFVSKRFTQITARLLSEVYPKIEKYLEPRTPLFSKQLAPGLGLAEDPSNGDSFGLNRCRILAEGIWNAYSKGLQTERDQLGEVIQQFNQYGISLERPYLSAGSIEQYQFPNLFVE
ncbi:T3SS effector HopA1 family protein [Okeania sp. KiyG1]|uniref:T3SS effector HopA1 family protein n=1 Tax=Okeania sp. KiyG1 TaxID=2720165 RepID=UPI0019226827|nr:T3SS effector HopA1 family protein [Okeania sp. KiyG1]GFZ90319.1 hypothetical protein CYANOKiyG1_00630 [Okeania sp. KiyG1]